MMAARFATRARSAEIAFLFVLLFAVGRPAAAQVRPTLPETDRIRLAEAFRLADKLAERVWKGWHEAPFAVLLVTPEFEFLLRHPKPSADFTRLGHDGLLQSDVYFRKRQFATNFQATFPAVNGVPTIVIGEAENTQSKTSTPWVVTLLHEHFHQWQNSQPDYYSGVDALGLAHGDTTGMWMLNYAFPYDRADVQKVFKRLCAALFEAVRAGTPEEFAEKLKTYREVQSEFRRMLSPDDYKYYAFQLWQEGVARYTELRVAQATREGYKPRKAFRALPDFKSYGEVAQAIREKIVDELPKIELGEWQRTAFYNIGAGEAMLLDRAAPGWQQRYLTEKFSLEKYFLQ
jgi:hypothetical protein